MNRSTMRRGVLLALAACLIRGEAAADLVVTPPSHDFGAWVVGSHPRQGFTVSNTGAADVHLGDLYNLGGGLYDFVVQNDQCGGQTLAPSASCTFEVVFAWSVPGSKSATVNIPSDDPATPLVAVALTGEAVACDPPAHGLVSWWPADGNAHDYLGLNHGELENGAAIGAGRYGGGFTLDGSDDFVHVSTPVGLPLGGAPRTVALRFRTPRDLTAVPDAALLLYGTGANGQRFGLVTAAGAPGKLVFHGHNADVAGSTTLAPDTWYHGAVTYDGTTVRLYLDGQPDGSADLALDTAPGPDGLTIGTWPGGPAWEGEIDDAMIFTGALAPTEIRALAATPLCLGGCARMDTSTGDFGRVLVESGASHDYALENDGLRDLVVGRVETAGADAASFVPNFDPAQSCGSLPWIIPPGATCNVRLDFKPRAPGPKSAQLRIESSDLHQPPVEKPLAGTGFVVLDYVVVPAGAGVVIANGFECHDYCLVEYDTPDPVVDLRAVPAPGWSFFRWECLIVTSENPRTLHALRSTEVAAFFSRTRAVCRTGCEYPTIQAAIDAISGDENKGDTVLVPAGTWRENVVVNDGKTFTLRGAGKGPAATVIKAVPGARGAGDGSVLFVDGDFGRRIDLTLENLTLSGGNAARGGGIRLLAAGAGQVDVRAEGVALRDNHAGTGGGIHAEGRDGGTLRAELTNIIIAGNDAAGVGGGLYATSGNAGSALVAILNGTVTDNRAARGGGAGLSSSPGGRTTLQMLNTIDWGNRAANGADLALRQRGDATVAEASFSDVGEVALAWGWFTQGPGNFNARPLFINPALDDYRLHAGSPCLDRGTPNGAPSRDFEGQSRPRGAGWDVGADERALGDTAARVRVVAPNGGEVIPAGQPVSVNWLAARDAQDFRVWYSLDGKRTWTQATTRALNRTSTFLWRPPPSSRTRRTCWVRVTARRGGRTIADASNRAFSIEVVRLRSPDGGEVFGSGERVTARWDTFATVRPVRRVQLAASLDGGKTWSRPTTISGNRGTGTVTLPSVPGTRSRCRLRVTLLDSRGRIVGRDLSTGVFTIRP